MIKTAEFLKSYYLKQKFSAPELHIVLGSGLAPVFDSCLDAERWEELAQLPFGEVSGLVPASVPGHKGHFRYFRQRESKKTLCFQVGRLHGYEGHEPSLVVKPLVAAFEAGTTKFLLTNAAGGVDKTFSVGSVMLINDHVNLTGRNPLYGPNPLSESGQPLGPRFPDMSQAYSKTMQQNLRKHLLVQQVQTFDGIYLGVLGPSFETPAEIRLFSNWGMGAVGMSTVWESIALAHVGAEVAGLSFISNMGCGLVSSERLRHEDVEAAARSAAPKLLQALFDYSRETLR